MPEDIVGLGLAERFGARAVCAADGRRSPGFAEHTDREVGRLVDAIDEIGVLDNTLFIYIMGDNGSSGEGGLDGDL